ncbi:MAG: TPR end-of-group domain-containing protein [Bacteroidales bacterium]
MALYVLSVLLFWSARLSAQPAQDPPRGAIVDKVTCQGDPGQSYALYLPSTYSPDRKWPILYAFDPGARGGVPVRRFADAAERYGFIVVGSNNSRNGPLAVAQNALNAMLDDTRARFSLERKRLYVTGFSGGARVASVVGMVMPGEVAGVIAFGAGFQPGVAPSPSLPFVYYAAVGIDDFNFPELQNLNRSLEKLDLPHRLDVFEGGHEWPSEIVCRHALEWMELQAMRSGLRTADAPLVEEMFARASAEASADEAGGRKYQAFARYAAMASDFAGLREVAPVEQKVRELERSPEVAHAIADLKDSVGKQERLALRIERLARGMVSSQDQSLALAELLAVVFSVKRQAAEARQSPDRMAARRVLTSSWLQFNEATTDDFDRGDFVQAAAHLRVMAVIRPENAEVDYSLARASARLGHRKEALDALRRAVAKGFKDVDRLEREPDLALLKADPAFHQILDNVRKEVAGRRPTSNGHDAAAATSSARLSGSCVVDFGRPRFATAVTS